MTDSSSSSSTSFMQELLQAPVYLGSDHVLENVIPAVLCTIGVVTLVYCAAFPLVANRLVPAKAPQEDRRTMAYQCTNLVTNTILGFMGVYFQYFCLPHDATPQQRIEGLQDLYILGAIQIGFQIWSIAVGLLFVKESTEMLLHHVAVILASSKSVFLTNGFRYYAPLALGMTELSSIPLSIMNSFKNNASWRDAWPQFYLASRLTFSFCFLIVRIGIFVPAHVEYLQYSFWINYHAPLTQVGVLYKCFMGLTWLGAVFLLALQLYWGYLIVNGLSKFVLAQVQVKSKVLDKKQL